MCAILQVLRSLGFPVPILSNHTASLCGHPICCTHLLIVFVYFVLQDWSNCRKECSSTDQDFVEHCKDNFKTFFSCITQHSDYYQPFLEMFDLAGKGDKEKEVEAASKEEGAVGHEIPAA